MDFVVELKPSGALSPPLLHLNCSLAAEEDAV